MAQTAGGKRKELIWDLVKDVESVIKKDGNKTSEKRWVCRFCEKPLQEARTSFGHTMGHPADVKARLQQEMSSTLRSIAEKETSEVKQIIRQEEAHVDRMASAGIDSSMLVESPR